MDSCRPFWELAETDRQETLLKTHTTSLKELGGAAALQIIRNLLLISPTRKAKGIATSGGMPALGQFPDRIAIVNANVQAMVAHVSEGLIAQPFHSGWKTIVDNEQTFLLDGIVPDALSVMRQALLAVQGECAKAAADHENKLGDVMQCIAPEIDMDKFLQTSKAQSSERTHVPVVVLGNAFPLLLGLLFGRIAAGFSKR